MQDQSTNDLMYLALVLRSIRTQAGLTQAQAAALVHAGLRTYSRWESGRQAIPPAELELLQIKIAAQACR